MSDPCFWQPAEWDVRGPSRHRLLYVQRVGVKTELIQSLKFGTGNNETGVKSRGAL